MSDSFDALFTFGSGFNMESQDPAYIARVKADVDYAHSKGIEIGGYTLTASATGLTSATSSSITVSVGAAAKLVFTTQPGGSPTGGTAFPTQPVVQVQDAGVNIAHAVQESAGETLTLIERLIKQREVAQRRTSP